MKGVYERSKDFVGHLLGLAQPGREDRAALAALRSGLGQKPGASARMHKYVVPYLGERAHHSDCWFYAVGALFAWHPQHEPRQSLGAGLGALWGQEGQSDSVEVRFVTLLNSHPDDLPDHLRQAVGLLRSKEIGLDWFLLLRSLINWDHPDRRVQNQWARDFYRQERPEHDDAAAQAEVA